MKRWPGSAIELEPQVLAAAAHGVDPAPSQGAGKPPGCHCGVDDSILECPDAHEPTTGEVSLEEAPGTFYLGKFRHVAGIQ
jgi:hypothetical protein